jgi:hypothetical protein
MTVNPASTWEKKSKREVEILMSFVVKQSSGDQPNVKLGWKEARIPRFDLKMFKAEGNAD